MCLVSFVGDTYRDLYRKEWPQYVYPTHSPPAVSKADFDALKAKVEEMIALLKAAQEYDKLTGQADCQMEDKVEFLKKVAAAVGVDLDKVMDWKKASAGLPI